MLTVTASLGVIAAMTLTAGTLVAAPPGAAPHQTISAISWHPCALGPDDAEGRALDEAGVECADVTVPLDYAKPDGRTIAVAIARSRGADGAHHIGSLIINLGGPASPVLDRVPLRPGRDGRDGRTLRPDRHGPPLCRAQHTGRLPVARVLAAAVGGRRPGRLRRDGVP
ncbi:hypothetical protein GCM10020358_41800 [Amorphoplanes nipponensis]